MPLKLHTSRNAFFFCQWILPTCQKSKLGGKLKLVSMRIVVEKCRKDSMGKENITHKFCPHFRNDEFSKNYHCLHKLVKSSFITNLKNDHKKMTKFLEKVVNSENGVFLKAIDS